MPFYWIVDPDARTLVGNSLPTMSLEAYALRDGAWVDVGSYGDADTARIPPFEAVEIALRRLFLPQAQSPPDP